MSLKKIGFFTFMGLAQVVPVYAGDETVSSVVSASSASAQGPIQAEVLVAEGITDLDVTQSDAGSATTVSVEVRKALSNAVPSIAGERRRHVYSADSPELDQFTGELPAKRDRKRDRRRERGPGRSGAASGGSATSKARKPSSLCMETIADRAQVVRVTQDQKILFFIQTIAENTVTMDERKQEISNTFSELLGPEGTILSVATAEKMARTFPNDPRLALGANRDPDGKVIWFWLKTDLTDVDEALEKIGRALREDEAEDESGDEDSFSDL